MKQSVSRWIAGGIVAFGFSSVVRADLSQTITLQVNTTLSLDTGAISGGASKRLASGDPDILWNGSSITPQGRARAANFGAFGQASFDGIGEAQIRVFAIVSSAAPIPASTLVVNDIFFVFTNGGNTAKVLVTAASGSSITLRFTTFIEPVPTGPTITAIQNNSSRIPAGYPNHGIAPSSIFVVQGNGLADAGDPVLQSSASPGIPQSLNGASITVMVNGVTTNPALYYTSPRQLAAVLPAGTPVGTGTLTVTYRGSTSAPRPIQVVASALGINTYNGSVGVATDAVTGALLTYTNSGSPGQNIVLWTTGLGANPADSDTTFTTEPHSVNTPLEIYIGGVAATILYKGSSGYPGVNQINVTIPQSVLTGCWVPLAAVTGNIVSNVVTLPINNGGGACIDAQTGLTGEQLSPTGGRTLRTGLVSLIQTNSPASRAGRQMTSSANAAFLKYTGIYSPRNSVSPGGCILNDLTPVPVGSISGMDAGSIKLTGPSGLSVTLSPAPGIKGTFFAMLQPGAVPPSGGTFTFSGSGGADVGSFTSILTLLNPLLTWTNQSAAASIDRAQGLRVAWTGGNPGSYVFVTGTSATAAGLIGGFTCLALADAGQFTVPSYILLGLPPGNGAVQVQNYIQAPLSASGLDSTVAIADVGFSVTSAYR